MRHGWKWWETFWIWLLDRSETHSVEQKYLKAMKKEFEELVRTGKIRLFPLNGD